MTGNNFSPAPDQSAGQPTGQPGPSDTAGWQTYQDPRFGFRVATPQGWALHADERAIHLWNQDGSVFVLVVPFQEIPGQALSDVARIAALPGNMPSLFPQPRINAVTPASAPGSNAVGEFTYQSGYGAGLARAMLSRRQDGGGGMLFAIAAPAVRFESKKATLLQILNSLTFGAPPTSGTNPPQANGNPADPAAMEQAINEAARQMSWTRWSDPRENSFSVEVPQGWTIEGGAFRYGTTDIRKAVQARSPDGDSVVQIGDPGVPLFELPTQMTMFSGLREGQIYSPTGTFQAMIAPHMPARGFCRWYLTNFLGGEVEGATLTEEKDLPEASQQQTIAMQRNGSPGQVEVAQVEFRGRSRRTGKSVSGLMMATLTRFPLGPMGGGIWAAHPVWGVTTDEGTSDAASDARKATAAATLLHLMQSWQEDPQWTAQNNQVQAQITRQMQQNDAASAQASHEMAMDNIRAAGERSRMIAHASDERRQSIMGAYQQRRAAQDNTQRQFVNYLGDRTDVRNPGTGQAYNVGSGYQHYYHDARTDTVLGTDSAYSPGVDWTPLDQF